MNNILDLYLKAVNLKEGNGGHSLFSPSVFGSLGSLEGKTTISHPKCNQQYWLSTLGSLEKKKTNIPRI